MTDSLMLIKDRLFPEKEILDWCFKGLPWNMYPQYRIYCRSNRELMWIQAVSPNNAFVHFLFPEDFKQELLEKPKPLPLPKTKNEILKILKEEERYFNKNNALLRQKYPNCFVAIKNEMVIDDDPDREEIGRRVYERYKNYPVLIRHVESVNRTVFLRSPKIKRFLDENGD